MVLHVLLCRQGSRLGSSCRGLDDFRREVGTTFREWAHARKKQRHNCCKRWLRRTRPDRHRERDESGKKPQSPFWSMPIAVWGSWGEGRHHGLRLPPRLTLMQGSSRSRRRVPRCFRARPRCPQLRSSPVRPCAAHFTL